MEPLPQGCEECKMFGPHLSGCSKSTPPDRVRELAQSLVDCYDPFPCLRRVEEKRAGRVFLSPCGTCELCELVAALDGPSPKGEQ